MTDGDFCGIEAVGDVVLGHEFVDQGVGDAGDEVADVVVASQIGQGAAKGLSRHKLGFVVVLDAGEFLVVGVLPGANATSHGSIAAGALGRLRLRLLDYEAGENFRVGHGGGPFLITSLEILGK